MDDHIYIEVKNTLVITLQELKNIISIEGTSSGKGVTMVYDMDNIESISLEDNGVLAVKFTTGELYLAIDRQYLLNLLQRMTRPLQDE